MANPTARSARSEQYDFSDMALVVGQIQNEAGDVLLNGEASQQTHEADLAVTDVDSAFAAVKRASTTVDASGGGTAQTTAIATVPAQSLILAVHAVVDTNFNGNTTTTLEVGVSGNIDKYIDTMDFDPSMGGDESNWSSTNADENGNVYVTSAEAIIATWTNTASASAGAVTVTVYYIEMGDADIAGELGTAFGEVETTVNSLLAKLENHGILADS